MNCPLCGTKMKAEVNLTGGCCGHSGEGDYCYCDSLDVNVQFTCPKTAQWEYVDGNHRRTKKPCTQKPLSIGELSDQESLARWLTEHYVPTSTTSIY